MDAGIGQNEQKQEINIGMMGLVVNNGNMGCVALTYSFIKIMEDIAKGYGNIRFVYTIFEDMPDRKKIDRMCTIMQIKADQVVSVRYRKSLLQLRDIRRCDMIFDFTEGDSFSDIYGNKRFIKNFFYKKMVLLSGKMLILGPQTIGPFVKKLDQWMACDIIEHAAIVFSRDKESIEYVRNFSDAEIVLTTDVAFKLPYLEGDRLFVGKKKIGFNASRLLYFNEFDPKRIKLSLDFKEYANKLVEQLIKNGYDVFLIAHVNGDREANMDLHIRFPQTILVDNFFDPVEAKNEISKMDVMISPRMHSTIAAYSTGISVIPLSYSRKFRGLYSEIGLDSFIDMECLDTDTAVDLTIKYIDEPDKHILDHYNKRKIFDRIDVFYERIKRLVGEIIDG